MKLIALTKGHHAIVDDEDYEMLNQHKWHHNNGYGARYSDCTKGQRIYSYMHRVIMNAPAELEVDHKNGNKLDNRKENLRICTLQQNGHNYDKQIVGATSKYKGVCWRKNRERWVVRLSVDGKRIHVGLFTDEIEAAKAYNTKALQYYGEYAKLNVIKT